MKRTSSPTVNQVFGLILALGSNFLFLGLLFSNSPIIV